jgi:serine/threonine protein kinase
VSSKLSWGEYSSDQLALGVAHVIRWDAPRCFGTLTAVLHLLPVSRGPDRLPSAGLVDEPGHLALVMRYYKRGSIAAAFGGPLYATLDMPSRLRLALQVATGMQRLHSADPPIIHGDLKCGNILFEDDGRRCVIADFGLARCLCEPVPQPAPAPGPAPGTQSGAAASRSILRQPPQQQAAFTAAISPPEVLLDPRLPRTQPADVYAFGIVLLEMATGQTTYRGMSSEQVAQLVMAGMRPGIPPALSQRHAGLAALIAQCWSNSPDSRPTFSTVVAQLQLAGTELDAEPKESPAP